MLEQFDPITERIMNESSRITGQRIALVNAIPGLPKDRHEFLKPFDKQPRMGLSSRTKVGLNPEMNLHALIFEPSAASSREFRRFRHLRKPKQLAIKYSSLGFSAGRHRKLYVIYADNRHLKPRLPNAIAEPRNLNYRLAIAPVRLFRTP